MQGKRLAGKAAIVTGAASGIGAAIAKLFAAHGARVAGFDRSAPSADVAAVCEHFAAGDVADEAAVNAFVGEVGQRFGAVDVLVNNAGADVFGEPLTLTTAEWQRNLATNLGGAWNFSRAALPFMLERNAGSIVNIASVHGHKIIPGAFPYPVAKHGLIGMTKALGIQYAARGVRCNSISPGLILVERIERWFEREPDARARQTELLPCKRIGTPEEVAYTALFLASDEARFINAADILIDGGRSQLYHE
ncbi:MAG: SDR family oxidoreductase [Rudaea sp.]|uniref:SDR family oxidoreductase n=1 Tax=unclassified Rudaea TaxID=2627037 RepID=UPI0010F8A74F|nr:MULTISPECIES: SDR family oxidoreductase [unclassified Rudaea]MBN8885219.1 SDR family oxidoreductase [Rudaea sp.]MBR0345460.1 SDR family oxidoreductase [Rudaea sp.]